ncbi:hypothetical protein D3C84_731280 [compost metagenome]
MRLQRKRPGRVLQRQQAADLALTREFLTVILAFDLQGKRVILRCAALLGRGFRRFVADDFAEGNRLAQGVDQQVQLGFQALVVEGDMPLVEADRADIQHPG